MSINQINFLPASYLKERSRQLRIMRESMLIAIVACLIIVWYLVAQRRVSNLEHLVEMKQAEVRNVAMQLEEMAQMDRERAMLTHQLRLEQELSQPVNLSRVVATLAQFMPGSMALTDMSIQTPVPRPPVKEKADDKRNRRSEKADIKAAPAPVMKVSIVGLAASDMEVADFIGRLTEHALFSKVQLAYTRAIQLADKKVAGREFRMELEIRLDRLYVTPASERRLEGVAHVN